MWAAVTFSLLGCRPLETIGVVLDKNQAHSAPGDLKVMRPFT
jgi:hypothetical protein